MLATQRTPSGRTDNLLYAYGEVAGSVDLAARLLRLAAAVAESLTIDAARALEQVRSAAVMATDAAEALSLERGIDYRSAYRAIGEAVAAGTFDASDLDPVEALATRTVVGGAAAAPMDAMVAECRAAVSEARGWIGERRASIAAAEEALIAETAAG